MKIGELSVEAVVNTSGVKTGKDKLVADLETIEARMAKLEAMGKKNTPWYKEQQRDAAALKKEITDLDGKTTSLFRQRKTNLGADLVIISFGVRQIISDFNDLSSQLASTDKDFGKFAGSAANMTISLLAMVPAIKAIGTALPAPFLAALAPIAAVTAALAGMYVFITKFKDQLPALDRAMRFLFSDLSFDDAVKEFEDLDNAIQNTAHSMLLFGKEKEQFESRQKRKKLGLTDEQIASADKLDEEQAREEQDKFERQQGYQKTLYDMDQQSLKVKQTGHTVSQKQNKEELDFLQKYQAERDKLLEDEKKLNMLLEAQTLTADERLNLTKQLEEVVKSINELMGRSMDLLGNKVGDISALRDIVLAGKDDNRFGKPIDPKLKNRAGKGEEDAGISFERWTAAAQNIHNILNQPLDSPFKTIMAMLQIAQQIAVLINGGTGGGAGALLGGIGSLLGPVGGIIGTIFGGIFGGMKKGGGAGQASQMHAMLSNFAKTGSPYSLPAGFHGGVGAGVLAAGGGMSISINGRKMDNKFREEIYRDGFSMNEFNYRSRGSG